MNSREKLLSPAIRSLHEAACKRGEEFYIDPESGRIVFTRLKHLARGSCCGSGCRHCPYEPDPCESGGVVEDNDVFGTNEIKEGE